MKLSIIHPYRLFTEVLGRALAAVDGIEVEPYDDRRDPADPAFLSNLEVAIIDPSSSNREGIDLIRTLKERHSGLKLLVLMTEPHWQYAFRLLRAGAMGCITNAADSTELVKAIRRINRGKIYLPPQMQRIFAEQYVHPEGERPEDSLSDREFQVMRLLAAGNTNGEISEKLFIAVKTVDTHRANLLRKLGLRNNADIARFAVQKGFLGACQTLHREYSEP